jgi:hypothetical protein
VPDRLTLGFLIGFAVVTGVVLLVWLRHRAAAAVVDDPSILLSAPPPGMTAATAAMLTGAPTRTAFLAGLLDLASRDEIAFVDEGVDQGIADIGIAIHGGPTDDARVLLNRRQAAGEGELWLLGQLQVAAGTPDLAGLGPTAGVARAAAALAVGPALFGALLRERTESAEDEESAAARAARSRGLLAGGPPDAAALEQEIVARTGHPLSPGAEAAIHALVTGAGPDALQAAATTATTAPAGSALPGAASDGPAPEAGGLPAAAATAQPAPATTPIRKISAAQARLLTTPVFFGTAVQAYAKRRGWIGRMPVVTRLLWRAIAAVEGIAAIAILSTGVSGFSDLVTGVGVGALFGAIATWIAAPRMAHVSAAGGVMRAQLAAYRRTLRGTFASASSVADIVGPTELGWLATPDQAVVWGVGLGLADEIAALLTRDAPGAAADGGYVPFWSRLLRRGDAPARRTHATPAEFFAGIRAIGSTTAGPGNLISLFRG